MLGIILILFILVPAVPIALIREKRYVKVHLNEVNMKARFWVMTVMRCLLLAVVIAAGYFIYKTGYEKHEIDVYQKDEYQLVISKIGVPDFPFGQSYCRLTLLEDGKKIDEIDITLQNDGKQPDEENFTVSWIKQGVSVTAHGEEQDDVIYVLYFDKDLMNVLEKPQTFNANFIEWVNDGMRVSVCDSLDNAVFPNGAQLTIRFDEDTCFIDLDGSTVKFNPHRSFFEPKVSRKLKWVEGMVLQIEFTDYQDFIEGNGYRNLAIGRKIENVEVIAVDVD